jgi:hypothetical protein
MKRVLIVIVFTALMGGWNVLEAGRPEILDKALTGDAASQQWAVDYLRAKGPDSLKMLFDYREVLQREITAGAAAQSPTDASKLQATLEKLEQIIDQVAGQRYACHSRLYWYTDLGAAQQAAAETKKPILSLRMLGKLTEDFSCANSRFFRTTLYANQEVSALLREKFVLHWQSVRPVPRVTIDFGDGRKLERTLTGNSIHHVLTADGQVIDSIPGLYGPAAFIAQLNTSLNLAADMEGFDAAKRDRFLIAHHQQQLARLDQQWASDFQQATLLLNAVAPADPRTTLRAAAAQVRQVDADPPAATKAVHVAVPKQKLEARLVRAAVPSDGVDPASVTDERLWQVIAQLHAADTKLDEASLTLIRSQNPAAAHAGRIARTKARVEDPIVRVVRSLESSIAIDTVRNEYQLHRQIHNWLAGGPERNVMSFNEKVYAQLFLTPSSDPWLGLAPVDGYTALPNGGVAQQQ